MFSSKILLFGEYTVLLGSDAIALPYHKYHGELAFPENAEKEPQGAAGRSNKNLNIYLDYLKAAKNDSKNEIIDIQAFEKDIKHGLYFRSDVPEKSGLGSSGCLVAALYDKYKIDSGENAILSEVRHNLALLESCFHKTSSGIDPLVSFLNSPLKFSDHGKIDILDFDTEKIIGKYGIFLVRDGQMTGTSELVSSFQKKYMANSFYRTKLSQQYIPLNNRLVDIVSTLSGEEDFYSLLREFVILQMDLFREMFPGNFIPIMKAGLENNLFYLKLCGSGGGGFILGFTPNLYETSQYLGKLRYKVTS